MKNSFSMKRSIFNIMARKKWTPKEEVNDSLLLFREKRKWQIALRRYVIEGRWGAGYASYFGLDIANFREWMELQFDEDSNWENFSKTWQFDHIVPVAYFDFKDEGDLRLCWNFINIGMEKLVSNKNRGHRIDVLAAKSYFELLYDRTKYWVCQAMVKKIERIEVSEIRSTEQLETFILKNKQYLETIADFSTDEFARLNEGLEVKKILEERDFLDRMKALKR